MQRVAFKMHPLPGNMLEYQKRHAEIWPELVILLKEAGIAGYCIFIDEETNVLFGSYAIESPKAAVALAGRAVMQQWWKYMADIMITNSDLSQVSVPLKELFYLS